MRINGPKNCLNHKRVPTNEVLMNLKQIVQLPISIKRVKLTMSLTLGIVLPFAMVSAAEVGYTIKVSNDVAPTSQVATAEKTDATDSPSATTAAQNNRIAELSLQLFVAQGPDKIPVVDALTAFNDKSLIPTFVLAMRLTGSNIYVAKALSDLTGEEITHWHEAYEWQERHPEVIPHSTFRALKLRFLGNNDKRFLSFFDAPHGTREAMRIRLEEIVWGGVRYDGIPALDNPTMESAEDADYMLDDDLVFGVEINGDARAYPLRIMGWHEMANDVVGGVPVALAYCTLCGSGILYNTTIDGFEKPLIFGSSGLLYRSNKLMFDRTTNSLWNQFGGEPVVGSLAKSTIKLEARPITITTWAAWRALHLNTTVLSLDTGYSRNYDSGVTYQEYFSSPNLMFPAAIEDESHVQRKEYVFGVRSVAASKAWPLAVFANKPIINDRVGLQCKFSNRAGLSTRSRGDIQSIG